MGSFVQFYNVLIQQKQLMIDSELSYLFMFSATGDVYATKEEF